ncbi:MAG: T9SS type A sorting domain-containing protein [Lentimicrobium sp.]|nr:T9SS type A sorting domain-containing protein [Lentimicrobium sp.]
MKTVALFFLGLLFQSIVSTNCAQTPEWTDLQSVSPYNFHEGRVVTEANSKDLYMAASISGPAILGDKTFYSIGKNDLLLSKYKKNGNTSWRIQIDAGHTGSILPQSIISDQKNNVYVVCTFEGNISYGSYTFSSDEGYNSFIAKFSPDKKLLWITPFTQSISGYCKMALDINNNAYVLNHWFLIRFSPDGSVKWEHNTRPNTFRSLAIKNNSIFIGGTLQPGVTEFGTIILASDGNARNTGFLLRCDLNGEFNHSFVFAGSPEGRGSSVSDIIIHKSGKIILTGVYTQSLILGSVSILNANYDFRSYIACCNQNFSFTWAKSSSIFENPNSNIISFNVFSDNSGNIYELGNVNSPLSYGAVNFIPEANNQFLFKFNNNGEPISCLGLVNSNFTGTIVSSSGKIVITGSLIYTNAAPFGNLFIKLLNNNGDNEWQRNSTGSKYGIFKMKYIQHDNENNVYARSEFTGYCNYWGNEFSSSNQASIIARHNQDGNLLWVRRIDELGSNDGTIGPGIRTDNDNNLIMIGTFFQSLTIDNTTLTDMTNFANDGFIAKFDPDGNLTFLKQLWAEGSLTINGLTVDSEDNIIISGEFRNHLILDGMVLCAQNVDGTYIAKYNSNGILQWAKGYPIGDIVYMALVNADETGNIYFTGEMYNWTTRSLNFGTLTIPQESNGGGNVLLKFDETGELLWGDVYGTNNHSLRYGSWPVDIETDLSGNVIMWGWCYSNSTFGDITITNPYSDPIYTHYLAKISPEGAVIQVIGLPSKINHVSYGDMLDHDQEGNIYVSAHFRDSLNINGSNFCSQGFVEMFIAKFSPEFNMEWLKQVHVFQSLGLALTVRGNDYLTLVGSTITDATFDGFEFIGNGGISGLMLTLGSANVPYVQAKNEIAAKAPILQNQAGNFKVKLSPNPCHGEFKIELAGNEEKPVKIDIYNSSGMLVGNAIIETNENLSNHIFNFQHLPKGIYIFVFSQGQKQTTNKLVIQ